jgi:hypothetical protein
MIRRKRSYSGMLWGDLVPVGHPGDAFHIGSDQDFHSHLSKYFFVMKYLNIFPSS